jgi:hypothetical protein
VRPYQALEVADLFLQHLTDSKGVDLGLQVLLQLLLLVLVPVGLVDVRQHRHSAGTSLWLARRKVTRRAQKGQYVGVISSGGSAHITPNLPRQSPQFAW